MRRLVLFALLAVSARAQEATLPEYRPAWSGLRDPTEFTAPAPGADRFRPTYSAAPGSDRERIDELERQVRDLRRRVDELERGRRTW